MELRTSAALSDDDVHRFAGDKRAGSYLYPVIRRNRKTPIVMLP